MPELPEVETVKRAVSLVALGGKVGAVQFHREDLRDPIPIERFQSLVSNQIITDVTRRSKYMILTTSAGHAIFHLGMSGRILILDSDQIEQKHTHMVMAIERKDYAAKFLHFIDPRRFGRITCCTHEEKNSFSLFRDLGPEPLEHDFDLGKHLWRKSRKRSQSCKAFLMDSRNVVGVGNIYANEALFRAGILPEKAAGAISLSRYRLLATEIVSVLNAAIQSGGTTLRDFFNALGKPGYFAINLAVYGRNGQPCLVCNNPILLQRIVGRSTFYCLSCQH